MGRFKTSATPRAAALLIALFFLLDRALSIGFLLPDFCVEDERWIQEGAVKMVKEATLDPGTHKYPELMFILAAGVYAAAYAGANASALAHFTSLESFDWHRSHYAFGFAETVALGRLLVAALGALALLVFYRFAAREFGEGVALPAMFFMATAPAFLFSTQLLKNDVLVVLGSLLAVSSALRVLDHGRPRDYILAGLAAGFCLAAKYHVAALVPVFTAHYLRNRPAKEDDAAPVPAGLIKSAAAGLVRIWRAFNRPAWLIAAVTALVAFMALSPWTWLDLQGTLDQGAVEWAIQNKMDPLFRRSPMHWWHAPVVFQFAAVFPLALGIPLYLAALAGMWKKAGIRDPRRLLIWSYPIGLAIFMIAMSELGVPHLYASMVPFFAILAALALEPLLAGKSRLKLAAGMVLMGGIAGYNLLLFHDFNRVEDDVIRAPVQFMEKTHKPGTTDLALIPYAPSPDQAWTIDFAPQFLLSRRLLETARPDRILIHQAYYHSFLDNPEIRSTPAVNEMLVTFLELRARWTDYREVDRWTGGVITGSWYRALWPDLRGLQSSLFERTGPTGQADGNEGREGSNESKGSSGIDRTGGTLPSAWP